MKVAKLISLLLLTAIAIACHNDKQKMKSNLEFFQDTIQIRNDSAVVIIFADYKGSMIFDTQLEVRMSDLMNRNLGERANRMIANKLLSEGKINPDDTLNTNWR